jgi:hypothetical protein
MADVVRTGVLRDAVPFVQQPFAPEAIAHKVREIRRDPQESDASDRRRLQTGQRRRC